MEAIVFLLALVIIGGLVALPIIAIVRTGKIRELELRIARLEAAQHPAVPFEVPSPQVHAEPPAPVVPFPVTTPPPPAPVPISATPRASEQLESIIGRRWIGLVAIALIVIATAFFLKYAFENRWIGELGWVTLGVAAGLTFVWLGYQRHLRGWQYFSQVLTGGGIIILYLSVYGAFAYYHLVDQRTAFVVLAILVVQAQLLAMGYRAPAIAILGLAGGFLVPVLLSTGRDQYPVLFTYIAILDLGMLGVVIARAWRWIGSLAYVGTQLLFWGWYSQHYHPEKRGAALLFQLVIFLIFVAADLAPNLRHRIASWEEWLRLAINPFVFYATCYGLLNDEHHDWMAALALLLATAYAGLARAELSLCREDRRSLFVVLGTALAFVTLAIPIQLNANWITIAWALEAVILLWAAVETGTGPLRVLSAVVFALAVGRFLLFDTPWDYRAPFTPVFNRYFLGMLALAACLAGAAWIQRGTSAALRVALLAFAVFWLGSSVESYSYFASQADAVSTATAVPEEAVRRLMWSARLSLSVVWSLYAGLLTAAGFRFAQRPIRIAGLSLFGLTLLKVLTMDLSELREFYRIIALLMLGLLLLGVAWKYQRNLRREPTS